MRLRVLWCVVAFALIALSACEAARAPSEADAAPGDGGPAPSADAAILDAGLFDAGGRPDAGTRDAGVDAGTCSPWTGTPIWINFDDAASGASIATRYAARGVLITRPGGDPVAFSFFASPRSPPNYLMAENEVVDLNPGTEYGNNQPALPLTLTFVDPADPLRPAVTSRVTLQAIYVNDANVASLEAFNLAGTSVARVQVIGSTGSFVLPLSVSAVDIHRVVVRFGEPGSAGLEDNAGVDDLDVAALSTRCP